ncbi:Replicase polyprotein 1ab [Micromonospora sp. WMMD975]|uniref:Replicase polyprotein 1ab n=1 Tax=Micromonospora sp. WMMD975 TaxID=3016087 RepID=UPI00249CEB6E|nr:Replicase polyprotein 1ab [Micromonospora sp. WMMD975]WFE35070.1 Replicase polyprotein 1ab [Micromonospora sp. WMMD975]
MADTVARHLVATGLLIDDDPALALAHAMAARRLASRIAAVREAVGLAAYHAGEWQTAIAELRTFHRMTGLQIHLAVLADCERALGRPERAIDLFRGADREKLDQAVAIELLIVAAGARGDLGQKDAAVAMLQVRELTAESSEPWAARLRYAYADGLLAVGRREEAREWFSRAADIDSEGETDAAERLLELDGVVIEGDDEDDEPDAEVDGPHSSADTDTETDTDGDLDGDDEGDDLDDEDSDRDGDLPQGADRADTAGAVDRADTAGAVGGAGDAAQAGYRDRDAGDLGDDELTDTEAGSLATTAASTDPTRDRPAPADAGDAKADDTQARDTQADGDEAAGRR